jgi:phage antirepressor YoqD-like protein
MMDNGSAMRICRTSFRIPFKDGGRNRWGVKPYDVHNLLRTIRPENALVGKKCDRMQEWVNALPCGSQADRTTLLAPVGEPVVFTYQDKFPNSFKADSGRIYVNATQMAKSFDKLPSTWLTLSSTTEFRSVLVREGKSLSMENQVMTTRGHYGATWIEEPLAMEFARWLSPEFSDWCNERIKELATKGYVSMGSSMSESRYSFGKPNENLPVPQNFEEALELALEQARKIREDQPKVEFYESFVEQRDYFKSSRIADELEISTVQLHRFLAENNIIRFEGHRWVALTQHQALQCDVPYMWEKSDGKIYPTGSVKRWTQAGREYIIELWQEQHPEIYRNKK